LQFCIITLTSLCFSNKSAVIIDTITGRHLDIFCAFETWHDGPDSPSIIACTPPDYKYVEKSRIRDNNSSVKLATNHGGICVFLRSLFRVKTITLPAYKTMETLALSIHGSILSTALITIYRPGSQHVTSAFFDEFSDLLENCSAYSQCIIVGDINIHLDSSESTTSQQFLLLLEDFDFTDRVNRLPTHRHGHQLDVFITHHDKPPAAITVDPPLISDHSLVVATFNVISTATPSARPRVCRRKWKLFNIDNFINDLLSSDLVNNPPVDNVDNFFNSYNDTLASLLEKHAPSVIVTKYSRPVSPWFDTECHLMKVKTRKLEKKYRAHPDHLSEATWRSQFTKQRALYQTKFNSYWKRVMNSTAGNSKLMWSKLRCLLEIPPVDGSNKEHSADDFADFFSKKIETIRQSTSNAPPPAITTRPVSNKFDAFHPVTTSEVSQLLKQSANKQCPSDPIPTWLLKRLSPVLSPVITSMFNSSFQQNKFPTAHKNAIVHPLLKKSSLDPDDLSSYRPISNLSFISKTLERLVSKRLSAHMDSQSLLSPTQSAYRANFSTETALIRIHNDIINAIDQGDIAALVLLDLSSAFDTVDHSVLINVLHDRFGICDDALTWMASYIQDRSQVVQISSSQSRRHLLECGVQQGSVLGPRQFITYIEDVDEVFALHGITNYGYADDMQCLKRCHPTQSHSIVSSFKHTINDVRDWCSSRRLQLNAQKTELIWFGSSTNLHQLDSSDSKILIDDSTSIQSSQVIRNLGVFFDNELTMRNHISRVTRSCYYQLRRLKTIRRHLGRDVTKCLVCSFILSRLDYCNSLLASLPASSLAPLQRVQNAAARLVLDLKPSDHITAALRELHWLPVKQRIAYKLSILVYKSLHHQAPNYLTELFTGIVDIPALSTLRSATDGKLSVPRTKLQFGERAFAVAGARQWNSLPAKLRSVDDFLLFKSKLKTHLFSMAFNL